MRQEGFLVIRPADTRPAVLDNFILSPPKVTGGQLAGNGGIRRFGPGVLRQRPVMRRVGATVRA
jgi:hypothetical protein